MGCSCGHARHSAPPVTARRSALELVRKSIPRKPPAPTEPSYRAADRAASRAVPAMERAFLRAAGELARRIPMDALSRALLSGDVEQFVGELDIEAILGDPEEVKGRPGDKEIIKSVEAVRKSADPWGSAARRLLASVVAGGLTSGGSDLEDAGIELAPGITQIESPHAQRWLREHSSELVTRVSGQTKDALREVLGAAHRDGATPREARRQIEDMIGLDAQRAKRYRKQLEQLRKQDLPPEELRANLKSYARRLIRERAETIARTESIEGWNEGRVASWRAARDEGAIRAEARRRWSSGVLEPTCEICRSLHGQERGLDEPFEDLNGKTYDHPTAHPRCRCSVSLIIPGLTDQGPPGMSPEAARSARAIEEA